MNNMSTADIREQFLSYFESQKNLPHKRVTSSSLIPGNDKTLMFTNAGMVQFKDVFLGQDKRDYERATTVQRCVRAGGKHNDLENVGHTARHHTFFEMMGNFSFGNYFKQEAIQFAWTFLTEVIGLPKEKLWITVFEEDDEAERIWLEGIGVDKNRLSRIGAKDNFWQMGDTGPCGPCTEIFYDHGEAIWGGPPGTPEEDGDRYIEIWNLVFMQYNRSADGVLHPLPKPSVDTGMGLERLAAILQGVHSNYETDIFQYLMRHLCELAASDDMNHDSLKVVADHIRSCAFMIADGVIPSNEGRGYVLRRIIRRALRHGHQLGLTDPFFHKMVQPLVDMMGEAYPELSESAERISEILLKEEQRFAVTLEQGLAILQQAMNDLKGDTLDGEVVFKLYDTYGFPKDLTADIARDNRLKIDEQGFDEYMEAQRQKARDAGSFATNYNDAIQIDDATVFTGYEQTQDTAKINHVFVDGAAQARLDTGDTAIVVLDKTPFYAESGGQVGDSGEIRSANGAVFKVQDTQKQGQAFIHIGSLQSGQLSVADEVSAEVDAERRQAIVTNHSATHLLHKVLRDTLGTHVEQKGSLVDADKLRFDFSHHEGLSAEQCQVIEQQVNQRIRANRSADVDVMDMDAAKSKGAMALFGEKYDDDVRVITLGDSMELCGGTHVSSTGDIGYFRISNESGIAAGVRRIEANTSDAAVMQSFNNQQRIQQFAKQLKATPEQLDEKLQQLLVQNRDYEKQLSKLKAKSAMMAGNDLSSQAVEVNGIQVLTAVLEEVDAKSLRDSLDQLKNKLQKAAILLASVQGDKVVLIAGVTKAESTQYPAGEMLAHVAQQIDGKGGGRPDMAQGGGVNSPKLKPAVDSVVNWIKERG